MGFNKQNMMAMSTTSASPRFDANNIAWENPVNGKVVPSSTNSEGSAETEVIDPLRKDVAFIKRYASDAESDVLYSLLASVTDTPNRLEVVMYDMLGLPNIPNLTQEHSEFFNHGLKRKRKTTGECAAVIEAKKSKIAVDEAQPSSSSGNAQSEDTSNEFLKPLMDMFPDADETFLKGKCQNIKDQDDCSIFISAVMLRGLYPKKEAKDDSTDWDVLKTAIVTNETVKEVENKPKNIIVIDLEDEETDDLAITAQPAATEISRRDEKYEVEVSLTDFGNPFNEIVETPPPGPSASIRLVPLKSLLADPPTVSETTTKPREKKSGKQIAQNDEQTANLIAPVNQRAKTPPPGPSASIRLVPLKSLLADPPTVSETTTKPREKKSAKQIAWNDEQTANLIRIFPNTDPSFLKAEVVKMNFSDEALNEFVVNKLETNDMPTKAEYEKRIAMEDLQNRYTKNFSVQEFLKAIPDPWAYFSDPKRDCTKYKDHSLSYLISKFRKLLRKDIKDALSQNNYNLYLADQHLSKNITKRRYGKRAEFECSKGRPTTVDIQFLQEVAFIENEEKIKDFLKSQRLEKEARFEEDRKTNSLYECQKCFDYGILFEDVVFCPENHLFCKNCVNRAVTAITTKGEHHFKCLKKQCSSQFTLSSLQSVLKPEEFSKILNEIQILEIKAAGIEGLVQCPFCNYATILPPEEKVMTCLNPECLKESCRLCKELNHIPLRCEEVRLSDEEKLLAYIEKKTTEALRTCNKCNKKLENEGMTCACGVAIGKVGKENKKSKKPAEKTEDFIPKLLGEEGIHDVTAEFRSKMEDLMNKSVLNKSIQGQMFKVRKVKRIFFKDQFSLYIHHREKIEEKKPPTLNFVVDTNADWMAPMLKSTANEVYLFHGTTKRTADQIAEFGFDDRLAKAGLYGTGIYFAENADKSDQYAAKASGSKRYMFLSRVTLGRVYETKVQGQWRRPPPIDENKPTKLYDSIVAVSKKKDRSSKHQEFILFDRYQCLPEFLIEYSATSNQNSALSIAPPVVQPYMAFNSSYNALQPNLVQFGVVAPTPLVSFTNVVPKPVLLSSVAQIPINEFGHSPPLPYINVTRIPATATTSASAATATASASAATTTKLTAVIKKLQVLLQENRQLAAQVSTNLTSASSASSTNISSHVKNNNP